MNRPLYLKRCQRLYKINQDSFKTWIDWTSPQQRRELRENITSYYGILWRLWYVTGPGHPASTQKIVWRKVVDDVVECVNQSIATLLPDKSPYLMFGKCDNPSRDIGAGLKNLCRPYFYPQQEKKLLRNTDFPEPVFKLAYLFNLLDNFSARFLRCFRSNKEPQESIRIDRLTDGEALAELGKTTYHVYKRFVEEHCQGYEDIAWFLFEDTYHLHFLSKYWRNCHLYNNQQEDIVFAYWENKPQICPELLLTLPDSYSVFVLNYCLYTSHYKNGLYFLSPATWIDKDKLEKEIEKKRKKYDVKAMREQRAAQLVQFFDQVTSIDKVALFNIFHAEENDLGMPVPAYCHMGEVDFGELSSAKSDAKFASLYHMAVLDSPTRKTLEEELSNYQKTFPICLMTSSC